MRAAQNYRFTPRQGVLAARRAPRISGEVAKNVIANCIEIKRLLRSPNALPERLTAIYAAVSHGLAGFSPFKGNTIRVEKYMQAAVAAWIYDRIDEDSSSRKYLEVLRSFVAHTGIMRFDRLLGVSSLFLKDYSEHLSRTLSPRTVNTNIQVLRSFFTWLHDHGLILRSPYRRDQLRKVDQRRLYHANRLGHVRRTLTRDEGQALLDWSVPQSPKIHCALALMLCLGLRRGEVVGAQRSDLITKGGEQYLTVVGKGGRTRILLLDAPVWIAIQRMLAAHDGPGRKPTTGPLICRPDGQAYAPSSVDTWVRQAGETIDRPDLTPHQLRYTHATLLRDAGVELTSVQLQLGHASPVTTQAIYDQGDRTYRGGSGFRVPA